ncbi:MAG: NAD(P)H-dependent oxidoreductase [Desulfobacter sp.]|nr:NAD(P)H-dependent oxidoreductase [Desulfobacter sp.]
MKFVILNGSPKGDTGITLQYVKFIQKHYPQYDYVHHNISTKIKTIEGNKDLFENIMSDIGSSDGIIWATPVYTLFVPAQYMRFIELVHEQNKTHVFKDKYAAVISTSIHFYDHTAHRYMNAVCDDLGMNYVDFFSAKMDDILNNSHRTRLLIFAKFFFNSTKNKITRQKNFEPIENDTFCFVPETITHKTSTQNKKIVIVTDAKDHESNIAGMIQRFSESFSEKIELLNLWDVNIKGGCTGCIKCGYDNQCMYTDSFSKFYRSKVLPADIVVFATELVHRNFSFKFKEFFDRRFFMNHAPEFKGKQVA